MPADFWRTLTYREQRKPEYDWDFICWNQYECPACQAPAGQMCVNQRELTFCCTARYTLAYKDGKVPPIYGYHEPFPDGFVEMRMRQERERAVARHG